MAVASLYPAASLPTLQHPLQTTSLSIRQGRTLPPHPHSTLPGHVTPTTSHPPQPHPNHTPTTRPLPNRYRVTYDQLSKDPNSLANLDQDLPNYAQHAIPIFSLPQEWLWCESWCGEATKAAAKTIDLCNNPKTKEPKLQVGVARRQSLVTPINFTNSEWTSNTIQYSQRNRHGAPV